MFRWINFRFLARSNYFELQISLLFTLKKKGGGYSVVFSIFPYFEILVFFALLVPSVALSVLYAYEFELLFPFQVEQCLKRLKNMNLESSIQDLSELFSSK